VCDGQAHGDERIGEVTLVGRVQQDAVAQALKFVLQKHATNLTRKDVKGIIEAVATIGHVELKKNGVFVVPGLIRMLVVKKPATKERKGINPFTKEPTVFKAKPARKVIKGRPVKAAKDAVA